MYELIERINEATDVKKFKVDELDKLAAEIREALFNRLTKIGGHFGPNFGIVEAEIALHYVFKIAMHYVFHSPVDQFVFDVSHQSYPHKILTGRKAGYIYEDHFSEDSGYTNPDESEHDLFNVGHTSTSISLATGLVKARDLKGEKRNVIALIGDGSLSGGEAMEALNVAGSELDSNLIIIVNDNEMAIAENHGGIYKNLAKLRETKGRAENNIFKAFGLDYMYVENGNDIPTLIDAFNKVKDIEHPIVVHIHTEKGLGYKIAEENKEAWHWCMPFNRKIGLSTIDFGDGEDYTSITADYIVKKVKKDKDVLVITPAMPMAVGLSPELREELGDQYIDVGIAEEQAVAMASGAAKNGAKPLVVTNMTFIQRTYDQISQDVCINNNPVTILLNYTSFAGLTDVTHLGIFGISAFSNIPNLVILAPSSKSEYINMLDWSLDQKEHPVMILIPGNEVTERESDKDYDNIGKFKVEKQGEKAAIIALGDFYQMGESLAAAVKEELGFTPTLINPRFASALDTDLLEEIGHNHSLVVTLEDGIVDGGFGHKIAAFYSASNVKVKNYGLEKKFYDRYNPAELLKELGMTNEAMVNDIKELLVEIN